MKNRCALFPRAPTVIRGWMGAGPVDTGPPGVRVRCRDPVTDRSETAPRADKNPTTMQIPRR